ncbi:SMP-30/gluconolactonase/LRE family protein [Neorhodopirellula pilleata]|uniref:Gluconolactonase n=1 Tax=Neorhodopirellula pilleata TaxID=2714738 RepID=A0A5C6ACJ2_9BACT|nr:SMP-30/gluconolactonase/LRE family protein [Neorhodopirellula pilleata]TWT97319.1 Gluconolactonase precursor [Neorhodopirellula pilleata]
MLQRSLTARKLFCTFALTALPIGVTVPMTHADETKVVAESVASPKTIEPTGEVVKLLSGFTFTEGPTMTEDGSLYFTDIPKTRIHRLAPDGTLGIFTDQSNRANGLWALPGGKMLACEMEGALVRYTLADGTREVLADQYDGKRFNACNDLVVDEHGGIYFTDPLYNAPTPLPQGIQAVYYLAADGTVSRLTGHIAAPNGIGLSLDGSKLYVIPSMQAEMLVFDVESAGKVSVGRTFCILKQPEGKSDTGGDGMTMDEQGNLYITTHTGVQIYSPEADYLGTVSFPEQPANVTFMGKDRKTMVVTARTSLYQVEMPISGRK